MSQHAGRCSSISKMFCMYREKCKNSNFEYPNHPNRHKINKNAHKQANQQQATTQTIGFEPGCHNMLVDVHQYRKCFVCIEKSAKIRTLSTQTTQTGTKSTKTRINKQTNNKQQHKRL